MSQEIKTTKCESCGKNVSVAEETSGSHWCPTAKEYKNVGNYLQAEKDREAAAKKLEAEKKAAEAKTVEAKK